MSVVNLLLWGGVGALLFLVARFEYRLKSPLILFPFALVVYFWLPHGAQIFLLSEYSAEVLSLSGVYVVLFLSVFLLFRMLFSLLLREDIAAVSIDSDRFSLKREKTYRLVMVIMVVVSAFLFIVASGSSLQNILSISWWDIVRSDSFAKLPAIYLAYSASALLLLSLLRKSKVNFMIGFLFLLFLIVVVRTRSFVLVYLLPLFVYWLYSSRLTTRKIVGFSLFTVVLFMLVIEVRVIRHAGGVGGLIQSGHPSVSEIVEENVTQDGEASLVKSYYNFVDDWPEVEGFGEGWTVIRLLFLPVPSSVLGDVKPADFTYQMWIAERGASDRFQSLHPTIFGSAYANLNWAGMIVFPVLISMLWSLARRITLTSRPLSVASIGLLALSATLVARGSVYNSFAFLFWPILMLVFIDVISRFSWRPCGRRQ